MTVVSAPVCFTASATVIKDRPVEMKLPSFSGGNTTHNIGSILDHTALREMFLHLL